MEKYYKKQSPTNAPPPTIENDKNDEMPSSSKKGRVEVNLTDLPADPGLRNPISSYHPTDRDQVRKAWLEYNVEKDAAFCLCCYLFGEETRYDAFITQGFKSWRKKERIENHVRGPNSVHNQAYEKCQNLLNQKQHIETVIVKQSSQARTEYRIHLKATLASVRFLLRQGLPFRGHDVSEDSNNMGNFLELLQVLTNQNEAIKRVVLENAPENLKLTTPKVQKDIVNAATAETAQAIIYELGDAPFSLWVDESRDISIKEQMAIVIRYVDKRGCVIERFLAIEHVIDTKA
ncbi:zinc finger MYM-type protein 1-like protein [Cinnamomum micranthum f. kanehirae]|uniref:Zinc finger MYM-type protein 1-like protein n=1 Tax=Cinnamomum micranthum f. kanehirae TaxID=337451 RepID=A0A3S3N3A1_9MAGN|nr:zinc finger MYM-type protein 1-like protein [Cinnamomum micranthum f. kanehirae]